MHQAHDLKQNEMIVLTKEEYQTLLEDAGDIALIDAARFRNDGAPNMPAEILRALLNGQIHPLAAVRKSAGLTQAALAQKAGLRAAAISDIENGKLDPRLSTMRKLAEALGTDIDDIAG